MDKDFLVGLITDMSQQMPFLKFVSIFCRKYGPYEKMKCISDLKEILRMGDASARFFVEKARSNWKNQEVKTGERVAFYKVQWREYILGYGNRLDSETFYETKELADKAIKEYWSKMPDKVPDYYLSPSEPTLVEGTPEMMKAVVIRDGSLMRVVD